jgi:outer membrane receptor for ferrienterochelin and colicin
VRAIKIFQSINCKLLKVFVRRISCVYPRRSLFSWLPLWIHFLLQLGLVVTPLLPSDASAAAFIEDEMVVTGSRSQRYLSDTAVPIQIIKKEKLDILGVTNLAGALSHMTGAYLTETRKQGQSLNINGYSAKHLLIMIDGQPIAGQGEDLDLSLIPIEGIDRIEVVKGPMSAYYGSGAMGGVVNLISQAPTAKQALSGQVSVGTAVATTAYQQAASRRISGRTAKSILWHRICPKRAATGRLPKTY